MNRWIFVFCHHKFAKHFRTDYICLENGKRSESVAYGALVTRKVAHIYHNHVAY